MIRPEAILLSYNVLFYYFLIIIIPALPSKALGGVG